jgi:cyclic pyranopterin phosphate synthase
VLEGIEAARAAGLGSGAPGHSLKVNMVVKRGTNEHEILRMARHFRAPASCVRFIEYMDVGATNGWRMDEVLPSADVVRMIHAELPLVAAGALGAREKRPNAGAMPMPAAGTTRRRARSASSAA